MPKSKSQRMNPVNKLAQKKEQQATLVYSQCLAQVQELDNQLQKLYRYRAGYNQQIKDQSDQGIGSNRLQDTLMFMNNLNRSIEGIIIQIQQQKKVCEGKKQLWMAMHNKTRIYSKVTEKYVAQEQRIENKNEQKSLDEFNQSLFHRRINMDHNSDS